MDDFTLDEMELILEAVKMRQQSLQPEAVFYLGVRDKIKALETISENILAEKSRRLRRMQD